jgi:hypothetical protein
VFERGSKFIPLQGKRIARGSRRLLRTYAVCGKQQEKPKKIRDSHPHDSNDYARRGWFKYAGDATEIPTRTPNSAAARRSGAARASSSLGAKIDRQKKTIDGGRAAVYRL